jgi:nickel superoxide dismutase
VIRSALLLVLLPLVSSPSTPEPAAPFHCQVPCGIYGDRMRIDMLMEDAATIEKGMAMIGQLEKEGGTNTNQMVRWVIAKDQHAQAIQETVASYWLAQRVKAPKDDSEASKAKYFLQLSTMHGITVAAMKCKQTTDPANVAKLRELALKFSGSYFSKEDLEHIHSHHTEDHQ